MSLHQEMLKLKLKLPYLEMLIHLLRLMEMQISMEKDLLIYLPQNKQLQT